MIQVASCINDSSQRLVRRIFDLWAKKIDEACRTSSVPPEFLAALVANESKGDPAMKRFLPDVHRILLAVRSGERPNFATLTRDDLRGINDEQVADYASAWGLTQILGYRVLYDHESPQRLLDPEINLRSALHLLAVLSEHCQVDMCVEFEDLFRCWKTGRPDGITADPHYVANGLRYVALYRELTQPGSELERVAA